MRATWKTNIIFFKLTTVSQMLALDKFRMANKDLSAHLLFRAVPLDRGNECFLNTISFRCTDVPYQAISLSLEPLKRVISH
jgi:hypothetical protein